MSSVSINPDLARAAHRLLHDDAFDAAIGELLQTSILEWSTSAPDDGARREVSYHKHTAISEIKTMVERWAAEHVA